MPPFSLHTNTSSDILAGDQLQYQQLSTFGFVQFYVELALAAACLVLALFSAHFLIKRDLPARGLEMNIKNIFDPISFLLVPVFLSQAGFFVCEAFYYTSIYTPMGNGLFFFCGVAQTCISWFSWLRSKAVISVFYSATYVSVIQAELTIVPILFTLSCFIQFLDIEDRIQKASVAMAVGVGFVMHVDISCLIAYHKQIFSLKDVSVDVPRAYEVIARYTAASTSMWFCSTSFYSISSMLIRKNLTIALGLVLAQDVFMFSAAAVLLAMKIQLIQPGLWPLLGSSSKKNKVKDFLEGSSTVNMKTAEVGSSIEKKAAEVGSSIEKKKTVEVVQPESE
ncbi:hypothetical protein HDU98_004233 [Podochytrium sp. JEL0797]|nr:hypothetical protein HDU98_004233 [Podochytrium sp. JEL0797]